ncbi:unnamed protein product [Prunus armeniaca]|uniref:Uncharacterized protein n=1 Tax=Prunus armeniaca TaxID=36596 RepID=A0A6J5XZ99_PRUAR|nr:unnamed protein product [Prunus armeniaca]
MFAWEQPKKTFLHCLQMTMSLKRSTLYGQTTSINLVMQMQAIGEVGNLAPEKAYELQCKPATYQLPP